jgi:nitroimidazol reductase NimA-like FMN-containing flavoprotein (pyridoxamine 5'-phosphate oxidase superfamily)
LKPLSAAAREYIDIAHVCRIATVRPGGEPHVIPVCPAFDGVATVYVDLGPTSASGVAIKHEARVAVLFDDYFDDWTKLRKVLLKCRAEEVSGPEKDAAWDRIRSQYPQYTTVDWKPRATMALRIYDWLQEGIESPSH